MGNFREQNREGVREIRENSRETTDLGTEMTRQAEQIKAVLDSIDLQDEEDIREIRDARNSYQDRFDSAFSEQVETVGDEIGRKGDQIQNAANKELERVRSGIRKLERTGSISDIGRNVAETVCSKLEGSAKEYEGIASDANSVVSDTRSKIESLKSNLSGIFG